MLSALKFTTSDRGGWPEITNVFGIPIDRGTLTDILKDIADIAQYGLRVPATVCLMNAFSVVEANRNPAHMTALRESDICLADGLGVAWLARTPKIAGADLMLAAARHPELGKMRHVLLGGFGVAYKAAITQFREARATDIHQPWIPVHGDDEEMLRLANRVPCDILWLALGCPKQELFMHEYRHELRAKVVIGVGAAFDFLADRIRRAPRWMQGTGLEWAWRIGQEPKRWRRQFGAAAGFLRLLLR